MSFKNCPTEYYYHCKNAGSKCSRCSAGPKGKVTFDLHYEPLTEKSSLEHPYESQQSAILKEAQQQKRQKAYKKRSDPKYKKRSKRIRKAFAEEKKLTQQLNDLAFKQTLNSGAVHGDGDVKSSTGLQIDHKYRESGRQFALTFKEYIKGKRQGTDVWIFTVDSDEGRFQIAMLEVELFVQLSKQDISDGLEGSQEGI